VTAEAVPVEGAMAEARVEAEMAAAVMVVVKEKATCEGEQGHEKAAPVPTHVVCGHGSCSAALAWKLASNDIRQTRDYLTDEGIHLVGVGAENLHVLGDALGTSSRSLMSQDSHTQQCAIVMGDCSFVPDCPCASTRRAVLAKEHGGATPKRRARSRARRALPRRTRL